MVDQAHGKCIRTGAGLTPTPTLVAAACTIWRCANARAAAGRRVCICILSKLVSSRAPDGYNAEKKIGNEQIDFAQAGPCAWVR